MFTVQDIECQEKEVKGQRIRIAISKTGLHHGELLMHNCADDYFKNVKCPENCIECWTTEVKESEYYVNT